MLTNTHEIFLNPQAFLTSGICKRCQEAKLLNAYGLCSACDHLVDEEYQILYQEPLELDVTQ